MATEIIFLLDRSGSMAGSEKDTIGGFNSFLKKQHARGETNLTAVLFDHEYDVLWEGVDAASVKLTEKEYVVRGMTALLDAIGKTILETEARLKRTGSAPDHVIVVITTDGLENSSREFTTAKVKELIGRKQEWDFVFMGANIDAVQEASSLGIHQENAFEFEVSEQGIEAMYDLASKTVLDRRRR